MTALTVKKLIGQLKKFPPDATIGFADHDHSDDEMNGVIRTVDEASDAQERTWGVKVVLR